jgi:hypothetical protein
LAHEIDIVQWVTGAAPVRVAAFAQRSRWRPVDPPRRPVLFVNPRSGGGKAARAGLAEQARERGVEAVILDPGQDLSGWHGFEIVPDRARTPESQIPSFT